MVVNKVTKLFVSNSAGMNESTIQTHFDEQNADGWYLINVDNLVGWYRFFWAKVIE